MKQQANDLSISYVKKMTFGLWEQFDTEKLCCFLLRLTRKEVNVFHLYSDFMLILSMINEYIRINFSAKIIGKKKTLESTARGQFQSQSNNFKTVICLMENLRFLCKCL